MAPKMVARLHKDAVAHFKYSLGEGLQAAVDAIPIDTGMAVNSLVPAMEEIGVFSGTLAGGGVKKGYTDIDGQYDPDAYKSPKHGKQLGKHAFSISYGSPRRNVQNFEYHIQVGHWLFRERGDFQGGPFGALEAMRDAFKEAYSDVGDRLAKAISNVMDENIVLTKD
jgi:hypothetical protein